MKQLGKHLLVELYDCDPKLLNNTSTVEREMQRAARAAKATIVRSTFHTFSPWGVSGVVLIAESHLTIHTWPEHNYAAIDIFTCGGSVEPYTAYQVLKDAFRSKNSSVIELKRGLIEGAVEKARKIARRSRAKQPA
ncbi:MAG: S-adenosylmethionine decarboxylase proenzyme [Candidatus Lindowbacteria bacterium RIFCSPLOWO2_12_FULL_62_27]|nr:MAG: S-adenosylmethionine decarboxylase proenzyme [Candidatus Lindowbacteria bacterium RIFCSPLOWO2_02_FULL_62_12]OGH60271.1 MAG: S-adenosylmethionine decarboxylase proenzyme [Candidatus Lindowbacteria bacterium RIFCSPLOWO2_12_FULL_62_27]